MKLRRAIEGFYSFLSQPLYPWARVVLAVLVVPLVLSLTQPLWQIFLVAPQYPEGLRMDIYAYKLDGGNDGHDIAEINGLNHYIGMRKIDRSELADLDWLPFALGAMALLALRVAVVGDVRSLLDLAVISNYVFLFSLGRFYYKLYNFGHHLDPTAPVKIKGFTPGLLGVKQIANFTTHSWPQAGTYLAATFTGGVVVLLAWHLIAGRFAAARAERQAITGPEKADARA